jgi:hypothetical protein
MKRFSIVLGICLLSFGVSTSYSQLISEKNELMALKRGDLKGPNAKNIKPGVYKATTVVHVEEVAAQMLKGPKAKNTPPHYRSKNVRTVPIQNTTKRTQLKGPNAKNYDAWKNRRDQ